MSNMQVEGWCPRGSGHVDGPDTGDYGACGGKWLYAREVGPWRQFEGWSNDGPTLGKEVPSPVLAQNEKKYLEAWANVGDDE